MTRALHNQDQECVHAGKFPVWESNTEIALSWRLCGGGFGAALGVLPSYSTCSSNWSVRLSRAAARNSFRNFESPLFFCNLFILMRMPAMDVVMNSFDPVWTRIDESFRAVS